MYRYIIVTCTSMKKEKQLYDCLAVWKEIKEWLEIISIHPSTFITISTFGGKSKQTIDFTLPYCEF